MSLYAYPGKNEELDNKLWDKAIIVLDTSALCSLYNLSDHYRKIMIDILKYFKGRLWIPYQVKYEYEKNRKKAINNPIREKYNYPSFVEDSFVKDVREQINLWKQNKYYHPFLETKEIDKLSTLVEEANDIIRKIKEITKSEYNKRKEEIHKIDENDNLKDFISSISLGTPFNFKKVKEIMKEGYFRYKNEIPPGYMDSKLFKGQEPKTGIRKYGDLIVWKEIMSHASAIDKDVILIVDDCKEDWYDHEDHKGCPRIELLTEFEEETNHNIWFYTTQQFIEELKKHYHEDQATLPLYDKLEEVIFVLERLAKEKEINSLHYGEKMTLRCEKCHKKFDVWTDCLDWESGGTYNKGMGSEQEWFGHSDIECPHCHSSIEINSFIFEYPEGAYNYDNTECDGAEIISEWNLETEFNQWYELEESEKGQCINCGKWDILDEKGLCSECQENMMRKIKSED